MALDPGFTTGRPYVYVLYAFDKAPNSTSSRAGATRARRRRAPTADGCVITGRLSRLERHRRRDGPDRGLLPAVPEPLGRLDRLRARRHAVRQLGRRRVVQLGRLRPGRQPGQPVRRSAGGTLTPPTAQGGALRSQSFRRPGGADRLARRRDPAREPGHRRRRGRQPGDRQRRPAAPPDRRLRLPQPVPLHVPARHRRDLVGRRRLEHLGGDQPHAGRRRRSATTAGRATRARRAWAPTTRSTSTTARRSTAQGAAAVTAPYFAYNHADKVVARRELHDRLLVDLRARVLHRQRVPGRLPRRAVLQRLLAQLHLGHVQGRQRAARTRRPGRPSPARPTARCG